MAQITDAQLKDALASSLKLAGGAAALDATWTQTVTDSNNAAWQDIVTRLGRRGYSLAQITAWDRGPEFNKDIGLFWCYVKVAGVNNYDEKFYMKLDRRLELDILEITIDGEVVLPIEVGGPVGYGAMTNPTDRFMDHTRVPPTFKQW